MASREIIKKKKKAPKLKPLPSSSVLPEKQDDEKVLIEEGIENTGYAHNPNASTGSLISVKEASEQDRSDNAKRYPSIKKKDSMPAESYQSSERSVSPGPAKLKKNSVVPVEGGASTVGSTVKQSSGQGSAISLRSKEAWTDSESITSASGQRKNTGKPGMFAATKSSGSSTQIVALKPGEGNQRSISQATLSPPEIQGEKHAYVPYLFARSAIAKIMDDMKNMKLKHVSIVTEIEGNFRGIEKETQNQFNSFVLNLRGQYSTKVKTFRDVIDVHRQEVNQKQQYWEETLMALSMRNKKLLQEKKELLKKTKSDYDEYEKETGRTSAGLVHTLDDKSSQLSSAQKDAQKLKDKLERERNENKQLRDLLEEHNLGHLVSAVVIGSSVARRQDEPDEPVVFGGISPEQQEDLENERDGMKEDRMKMTDERDEWMSDRKELVDERNKVQGELNMANMELSQNQARYDSLKTNMLEYANMKASYDALCAQYAVLAVAATSMDKDKAEEKSKSLENDKQSMEEEKATIEKDIQKWKDEFQAENGREPTQAERPAAVKELYTQLAEVESMIANLSTQQETLVQIQAGNVPQPAVVAAPVKIKDPEVKTIEVRVPDQGSLSRLEQVKVENAQLKRENSEFKNTTADLKSQLSRVQIMGGAAVAIGSLTPVEDLKTEPTLQQGDATAVAQLKSELREKDRQLRAAEKQAGAGDEGLKLLLAAAVGQVHELQKEEEKAHDQIKDRYKKADEKMPELEKSLEKAQKKLDKYLAEHDASDEESSRLKDKVEKKTKKTSDNEVLVAALKMLKSGHVPDNYKPSGVVAGGADAGDIEYFEEKISELELENSQFNDERAELLEKIAKLETDLLSGGESGTIGMEDTESLSTQIAKFQMDVDRLEAELREERASHDATKEELDAMKNQLDGMKVELENSEGLANTKADSMQASLEAQIKARDQEIDDIRKEKAELEQARLDNLPVNAKVEIQKIQDKLVRVEKEKTASTASSIAMTAEIQELKGRVEAVSSNLKQQKTISADLEEKLKSSQGQNEKVRKELEKEFQKKEQQRADEEKRKIAALQKKVQMLGSGVAGTKKTSTVEKPDGNAKALKDQVIQLKKENNELNTRIKQLESGKGGAAVVAVGGGGGVADKRKEKILKELEKKYEMEQKKAARNLENFKQKEEELNATKKDYDNVNNELKKLKIEMSTLGVAAKEGLDAVNRVKELELEAKKLREEVKVLGDNFNSERVLRKKYFNMVEDMKGKIRVYCRARPLSKDELNRGNHSVIRSPDEYTINVETNRGLKEFQFDNIFMPDHSQEKVFEDTNNLVQSAVDGYNVCIFAYGQTGSGKTFTMIGDKAQNFPGIAPRAFDRIFDLIEENKKKFSFSVSCYMMELYNDKLLDLFSRDSSHADDRFDIKKDKKGMVFILGAEVKQVSSAKELYTVFDEGSKNRHVASTMMNAESSRSHLIIGVVIESTNRTSGNVMRGKLSLVDLAGSERVAKTGATAQQLKEANSINKSLSALGDVISALSSEQSFIPYRNNKLTMLMQDSLGGNSKTLMFVNISPADYNADETSISLTYASRVKLITNDAQKNSDNKEIARLKGVISKLKAGEKVAEEEV
ncbi:myosin-9-like isoform X3 [Lineus longissimus]|uniref:myosin-9-like isoform X3 n=1 Tax=Lineus longissimus TaxID=88925 RepID=UPI00315D471B